MDILFLGDQISGYGFSEHARKNGMQIDFIEQAAIDLNKVQEEIMCAAPKFLAINIEKVTNSEEQMVDAISKLSKSVNCHIIVVAFGYSKEMSIINAFLAIGISRFVFSGVNLGKQAREIADCLSDTVQPVSKEERETILQNREDTLTAISAHLPAGKTEQPLPENFGPDKKRIAVIGSMGRIGTTTIALQLVNFLSASGKDACYIERNASHFVHIQKQNVLVDEEDQQLSKVVYKNTDMYDAPQSINGVLKMAYDYFIYDYGDMNDMLFDLASVLEKDIVLVVCGVLGKELEMIKPAIKKTYDHNAAFYIFNEVHPNERRDILEKQRSLSERTLFSAYSPDPFTYAPENASLFQAILNYKGKMQPQKKNRRGLFRR